MANLALTSLEIENYRTYKRLVVERFGRVNLIVGRNNVGKSSLLEALWIYTQRGSPSTLTELLNSRDELPRLRPFSVEPEDSKEKIWEIKNLFHCRPDLRTSSTDIKIGPYQKQDDALSIGVGWYLSEEDPEGVIQRRPVDPSLQAEARPFLVVRLGRNVIRLFPLDRVMRGGIRSTLSSNENIIPSRFITANGLNSGNVAKLWDSVALRDSERFVVDALHIIAPEIERISFLSIDERTSYRIPVARIKGSTEPVSVRSMGEGMNRILGMALALVSSKSGMLLIDEVESGLHYSVQLDVWRLLFRLAHQLNVQVFATTHSWDCIHSFQQAAVENIAEEGLLVRLTKKLDEIETTLFDEHKLSIATREQIEVR